MEDYEMTTSQAARHVGVSRTTITRAIKLGRLKAEKRKIEELNQEWHVIKLSDLEEWNTSKHRRKRKTDD